MGHIEFDLANYFVQNAVAPPKKIVVDCRPPYLQSWEEFIETEWSLELRKHALELIKELPHGVELIIRPVLVLVSVPVRTIRDPSPAVLQPSNYIL